MTTWTTKGKITLLRDGAVISTHTVAEEAYESALKSGAGRYVVRYPDRELVVTTGITVPVPASLPASDLYKFTVSDLTKAQQAAIGDSVVLKVERLPADYLDEKS